MRDQFSVPPPEQEAAIHAAVLAADLIGCGAPRFFFGLTAFVACPPGSRMAYEEWYDGESNQVRMYCMDPASGEAVERTVLALAVWLGMFFLAFFYTALAVLLIIRARNRRKYGVDT